jgi:hypothetical protein
MPLVLLVVVLVAGLGLLVVAVGLRARDGSRAQTAADAAALAGAVEGEAGARRLASTNGATVVAFEQVGGQAQVTVQLGAVRATARAELEPAAGSGRPSGGEGAPGLDGRLVAALRRAEALLGEPVPITSGWRSPAEQQRLWDGRAQNPYPVARPGTSMHERGLAVDVPRSFVARLRSVAGAAGLCFPLPTTDPVHFELCPVAWR